MKQTLIWFNLQKDGTGNRLSNIKDTFVECLQLQMFCTKVRASSRLVSQVSHMIAEQNLKKVPHVSDPNQNVDTT